MILNSIWKSLIKFTKDEVIADLSTMGINYHFIDWDTMANINELKNESLLGLHSFGAVHDDQVIACSFSVSYSMLNDVGLYQMRDTADYLFDRLSPERTIPIYSDLDQTKLGYLVLTDGTTSAPVENTKIRPFQFVTGSGLFSLDS